MLELPGKPESYWMQDPPRSNYPPLSGDLEVDVAVVGGGIVGLSAAAMLKQEGKRVAVLEARRITEQVTGRTTAKLTALHGLIYDHVTRTFGADQARLYADANQSAIDIIEGWAADNQIACDLERMPAYTFTMHQDGVEEIRREVAAASALGLPVSFVTEAPIPVPVAGAIRMDNQAQFHPRKFLIPFAASLLDDHCRIYEKTRVIDVRGKAPVRVVTDAGTVSARDVVVATNLPILDRGGHFARAFPVAHVAMTARVDESQLPDGMFITSDKHSFSMRPVRDGNGPLLLAVGPGFKTGHCSVSEKYEELEHFVRQYYRVERFENRWFNEDYYAADRVPYAGRLTPASDHIYIATGFSGWGLTNGVAAATVLTGAIIKRPHRWSPLYKATRLHLRETAGKLLHENSHVAKTWFRDHVTRRWEGSLDTLANDQAVVTKIHGEKIAAYRDETGKLHTVSAVCTHLGCVVQWNDAERTWDCPCHGSRFGVDGEVLQGPAVRALEPRHPDTTPGARAGETPAPPQETGERPPAP